MTSEINGVPENKDDWYALAQKDPQHYQMGEDGSIHYVADQKGPVSGLIDRLKGRKPDGLEQELEGQGDNSQIEKSTPRIFTENNKRLLKYSIPIVGNFLAMRDAEKSGKYQEQMEIYIATLGKYLFDGSAIISFFQGDVKNGSMYAMIGGILHGLSMGNKWEICKEVNENGKRSL